ncbi:MAG: hypothetical protein F6K54_31305 [Okeania sp. SIO3B5]|uniref:glycosyltransferase family 39 protein n=1 Tax=Okeania sp. SIO3B5 TaxID=2607811 RepID=UPI001400DF8C|nr:glycosyltransferase family 39 protein [Okeania sp. SIO3B5]NEO57166.1 hypothetical protein [Okeania sp. SIO3B5]
MTQNFLAFTKKSPKNYLTFILIIILFLGVYCRIANLDSKIYWIDEVATSLRVAGFTKQEVTQEIFNKGLIPISELQNYQKITNQKTFKHTIKAFIQSPEHTPLYFILARIWTSVFGSSISAIRSLSVLFSLLTLPLIYRLCQILFQPAKTGWIAVSLLSLSPLYVTYAQEARPYSLLVCIILLSQITLYQELRSHSWFNWFSYTISLILSIYTSLLSILVIIAQSLYVIVIDYSQKKSKMNEGRSHNSLLPSSSCPLPFLIIYQLTAVIIAFIAFSPWLIIMVQNWQLLQDNTTWMNVFLHPLVMIAIWFYSLATIFIETPIYLGWNWLIITRLIIDIHLFIIIFYSFYFFYKKTDKTIGLFILLQIFIPLLIMRGSDLIFGGQSSTAIRYMMPNYVLIHLTVAYLFSEKIQTFSKIFLPSIKPWIIILSLVLFIETFSCFSILDKSPQYQKTRNFHNPAIANIINHNPDSILLTEPLHVFDAISLSYILNSSIQFQLVSHLSHLSFFAADKTIYLLNPSEDFISQIQQSSRDITLEKIYQPELLTDGEIHLTLWKLS